jgi:hypothetical protein
MRLIAIAAVLTGGVAIAVVFLLSNGQPLAAKPGPEHTAPNTRQAPASPAPEAADPTAPGEDDESCVIRGEILDRQGAPVPQARLRMENDPARTVIARSDRRGAFSLRLPSGWSTLIAEHEGLGARGSFRCGKEANGWTPPSEGHQLVLGPVYRLEGMVKLVGTHTGEITLIATAQPGVVGDDTHTLRGPGRFEVPIYGPGMCHVYVLAEGHQLWKRTVTLHEGRPSQWLDVELQSGARFSGIVVDAEGSPLPGANLTVQRVFDWWPERPPILTDARGRFDTTYLSPDERTVRIWAKGYESLALNLKLPAEGLRLQLERARVHDFRIMEHGVPVASAQVALNLGACGNSVSRPEPERSDSQGRLRLAQDRTQAQAWAAAVWERSGVERTVYRRIPLPGMEGERLIDTGPSSLLTGQVLGVSGEPIGARVLVRAQDQCDQAAMLTDSDGAFRLPAPAAGAADVYVVSDGRMTNARVRLPATEPVTLRFSQLGIITGVVVDPAGRPLVTARVNHQRVGADGRFSVEGSSLVADAPGHVAIKDWNQLRPGDVGPVILYPTRTVTGRVRTRNGSPPEYPVKFFLWASVDDEVRIFEVSTDETGEFAVEVPQLPLGIGTDRGHTPLADAQITLSATATEVVLRLRDEEDDSHGEDSDVE